MMYSSLIIAQADAAPLVHAAEPGTAEIVTIGFLFVMVVLAALAVVTSVIGLFFARSSAKAAGRAAAAALKAAEAQAAAAKQSPVAAAPAAPEAPAAATPSAATSDSGEDPVLLAVIAAAVHSVIGDRPHRVIAIRRDGPGWAHEGRRQIFSSHRVR